MIPEARTVFPITEDPDPCEALTCDTRPEPVRECWRRACPFTWNRQAREDRAERTEKDAKTKEAIHDPY